MVQDFINLGIGFVNHLGKGGTTLFLMLRIYKQSAHVIRKVDQDFFNFAPFRDIREATAVFEFSNNLGITGIAVPNVENATVCRQEPNLTRERIDIVGAEH